MDRSTKMTTNQFLSYFTKLYIYIYIVMLQITNKIYFSSFCGVSPMTKATYAKYEGILSVLRRDPTKSQKSKIQDEFKWNFGVPLGLLKNFEHQAVSKCRGEWEVPNIISPTIPVGSLPCCSFNIKSVSSSCLSFSEFRLNQKNCITLCYSAECVKKNCSLI